ncbi:hypothetical protein GQ44DRAFT_714704 [Phaeosphaeriaceae sp. PMI808]|nr:hypothetical protein GQ44DRAFT_714704 [Phaeosphaeriaceae sp. PMI808]
MRLLHFDKSDRLVLTNFSGETIPPYAILSHRWGDEEVLFEDLVNDAWKRKAGQKKILFCSEQAAHDQLEYFWINTCCTIQTHHRRQRPTKRVAYAAENGGRTYVAFQYKRINISLPSAFSSENP